VSRKISISNGASFMDIIEGIQSRKSIRAFKPTTITKDLLEKIIDLTIKAPSGNNLQPWEFFVVSGEERLRLSRQLLKAYKEKQISCGSGTEKPLPHIYRKRGLETAKNMKLYVEKMDIEYGKFVNEGSCNFYGAPTAVFMCIDEIFPKSRLVDVGIALGYFVLAAHAMGLGTCPVGLISAYKDEVHDILNIPETKDIVISLALGYTDPSIPINEFRSQRDPLENFVTWID
jgi:nitroreductase